MSINNILDSFKIYFDVFRHYLPIDVVDWVIDWKRFRDFDYLLSSNSGNRFKFYSHFTLLFAAFSVFGLFLFLKLGKLKHNPPRAKFFKKLMIYFLGFSLTGFLLLFFRYENIKLLSSRIFFITVFWLFLLWGGRIIFFYLRKLPQEQRDYDSWLIKQKYLPKRKRKSY